MSEGPNELRTVPVLCVFRSVADCDKTFTSKFVAQRPGTRRRARFLKRRVEPRFIDLVKLRSTSTSRLDISHRWTITGTSFGPSHARSSVGQELRAGDFGRIRPYSASGQHDGGARLVLKSRRAQEGPCSLAGDVWVF